MAAYNLLTQQLFADGWTKDNHPDYVKDWIYNSEYTSGFEYTLKKQNSMVFETPCGLLVRGSHWSSGTMAYMGIEWCLENDNPALLCPYRKADCPQNHPSLREHAIGSGLSKIVHCACHEVSLPYNYERSVDKVYDEYDKHKETLFQEFSKGKRVCRFHCYFDQHTEMWSQQYNPLNCVNHACQYCTILDKDLTSKKGNIFYDLKITTKPEEITLFGKEYMVSLQKDKRLLERNVSLDLCYAIRKACPDAPQKKVESQYFSQLFFAKYHGQFFKAEAVNIRVQTRVSRDLIQDIADVQAGYTVTHEADTIAAAKKQKAERREKALQGRIRRAKRLISEHGIDGIGATDYYRVQKMIDKGQISEEEIAQLEQLHKEQQNVQQLRLF